MKTKSDYDCMVEIVHAIEEELLKQNINPGDYDDFVKIKNIILNKSENGFKNLSDYSYSLSRILRDSTHANNKVLGLISALSAYYAECYRK